MSRKTLLLSSNYEVLSFIGERRAFKMLFKEDKVDVISEWNETISWGSGFIKHPAILRLRYPITRRKAITFVFSRQAVIRRDNYTCQYCGLKLHRDQATMDHIVPKVRGGPSTFSNCVAACKSCNGRKGEKTLEEAGLKLLKKPSHPSYFAAFYSLDKELQNNWHIDWNTYIRD